MRDRELLGHESEALRDLIDRLRHDGQDLMD